MRSGRVRNRNRLCRGQPVFEVLVSPALGTTAPAAPGKSHLDKQTFDKQTSDSSIAQATEQSLPAFVLLTQGQSKWLTTASLLCGSHIQSPAHQRTRQLRVSHRSEKALASSHREYTEP